MQPDMSQAAVLEKQIADDKVGGVLLTLLNTTQENSSQQQEETSSAVSYQNWDKMNQMCLKHVAQLLKKSEEVVFNEMPQNIRNEALSNHGQLRHHLEELIKEAAIKNFHIQNNLPNSVAADSSHLEKEMSSTASCKESTLGWSHQNKMRLTSIAKLSEKSEDEVSNKIPQDVLSDPECLTGYLAALLNSLKNDSCTNDNPSNDVAVASSQMSSAACQECALTGENPTINEDCN
ncbi:MAG: hypothetical protein LBH99_00020 [Rickettsia sp.]|jgi:hypothetical protein|nr:hypothetical protein [Rickettsia sp.]